VTWKEKVIKGLVVRGAKGEQASIGTGEEFGGAL